MSVLIKGMKMPRHCGECGIEWCDRWKQLIIAGMSIAKTRPRDCPLIELPPHGRLIDADALMPDAQHKGKYDVVNAYDIATAPTILEAEVEE